MKRTIRRPIFEEEAGNGDTGTSVPSLARAMRKMGNNKTGLQTLGRDKTRKARELEKHSARSNKNWLEPKLLQKTLH